MGFFDLDISVDNSAPVEFYEFILGPDTWRFTTAAQPLICEGYEYEPAIISKGVIENTGEIKGRPLEITVSGTNAVSNLYRIYAPANPMALTIRRQQRGSTDSIIIWSGVARGVGWDNTYAKFRCESGAMIVGRTGLFRYYQTMCGHIWGSWQCGVKSADYTSLGVVTLVDDILISVNTGEPDDYFKGGFVEHGNNDFRMITASSATTITVPFAFENISVGDELILMAGCDRLHTTCTSKFDNSINYGGCLYVPGTNPFASGVD